MSRPGVEYETVEKVARQLLSKGQHPSVQRVRDVLKTGSNTTIAKHLKEWQANFAEMRPALLPENIPEDLMNPIDQFWSMALTKAESNYQQFKDDLETKLEAAVTAQAESIVELEDKTRQIEALQNTVSSVEDTVLNLKLQLSELQGKNVAQDKELKNTYSEIERTHLLLTEQNQLFEAESQKVHMVNEKALKYEQERTESTESRLFKKIDQLRQDVNTQESQRQQAFIELTKYKDSSYQQEIILHKKNKDLAVENKQLEEKYTQYEKTASTLEYQYAESKKQLSTSIETVEALRIANERLTDKEIQFIQEIDVLNENIMQIQLLTRGHDDEDTNKD